MALNTCLGFARYVAPTRSFVTHSISQSNVTIYRLSILFHAIHHRESPVPLFEARRTILPHFLRSIAAARPASSESVSGTALL